MAGINTYLKSLAVNRDLVLGMFWQSNCSGPGIGADFSSQFQSVIPNTYIYYNGVMSPLQLGVNNKNSPNGNGGYELTNCYHYQNATGKRMFIAKRDQGGTQIYKETDASSSDSLTIGTGGKSFNTATGRNWGASRLRLINGVNWMEGNSSAYDSGTGATTVGFDRSSGSGTFSSWTVTVADWNKDSTNEFAYEFLNNYVYPTIAYCRSNGIDFKLAIHGIGGEEDGLDTTKANAYEANTKALYNFYIVSIHNYIATNYPGYVIPHIKVIVDKTKSNAGASGITVRTAQANIVASNSNYYLHDTVNMTLGADNVHFTSAGFETGGPEVSAILQAAWL
jgi:hypothetical protein